MLSRATWRDKEKSSTLRSKSVLSLMQNWAAASLMVSCGENRQSSQNPNSPLPCPDLFTTLHHQMRPTHQMLAWVLTLRRSFLRKTEVSTHSFLGMPRASFTPVWS